MLFPWIDQLSDWNPHSSITPSGFSWIKSSTFLRIMADVGVWFSLVFSQ